jgi:hypothetical protein
MIRARLPAVAALVLAAGIYSLRLDHVAGLIVDDAWYIILARALAQGDGYRLISSAVAEILPTVPPGFPALLSLVYRINPAYPDNLVWMKLMSFAAIAGLAAACRYDFIRHRGLAPAHATLLVLVTVLTPSLVFLATSTVMAECVFALAQVAAVILVERVTRRAPDDYQSAALAGIAVGAAMLIRSAGAAVFIAAVAYLLLARRSKQAAACTAVALVCLLPWTVYARIHAPTPDERLAHGGTIAFSYQQLLTVGRLGDPLGGSASAVQLARRAAQNVGGVAARDLGAVVVPALYRGPVESGQELVSIGGPQGGSMGVARQTVIVSLVLSAIVIIGWLTTPRERIAMPGLLLAASVAMMAPVGGQTFRYLVPLAPYVFLFLWRGLRSGVAARVALLCVLGFQLLDHAEYIRLKHTATVEWISEADEMAALMAWMSTNLTEPGDVAATNPGLVYLATGRRAIASGFAERNWSRWKAAGVRYVVSTLPGVQTPPASLGGRLLYRSSRRGYWVVEM